MEVYQALRKDQIIQILQDDMPEDHYWEIVINGNTQIAISCYREMGVGS